MTNKKTYLFLRALERSDEQTTKKLFKLYNSKPANEHKKITEVKEIFELLDVARDCTDLIEQFYQKGMKCLNLLTISEENKELLEDVASKMIHREK